MADRRTRVESTEASTGGVHQGVSACGFALRGESEGSIVKTSTLERHQRREVKLSATLVTTSLYIVSSRCPLV